MSQAQQLLPSLFALLPPSLHQRIVAHLSLQSLHVEPYHITDDIYLPVNPVIPQYRTLRLRTTSYTSAKSNSLGRKRKRKVEKSDIEGYELSYVSNTLNGREYADVNVRAILRVDVMGGSSKADIEEFIQALGFRHSHAYSRSGLLFHIPTPLILLHLTITRLQPSSSKPADAKPTSEPWFVQLETSRPVPGVPTRGEPGIQDIMSVMRDVAERIDGLEWDTGR